MSLTYQELDAVYEYVGNRKCDVLRATWGGGGSGGSRQG